MTQVGEGQEAASAADLMTFRAPEVGEVLADRYQLEQHINNDSAGRQVWRGIDVVLRRPVAVVLRQPGGESATEMLVAAVAASRVVHPHIVGVYDAIDEGDKAYVVREWIEGSALRDLVTDAPLDPDRALGITHAIADAIAAVHASGVAHGNVHPGTVLIGDDGRVVLADARSDEATTPESDVRAVAAILYCALTGHWPREGGSKSQLPDAVRVDGDRVAAPRQIRAGVPGYLDELTVDLLNPDVPLPTAAELSAELGRMDVANEHDTMDGLLGPVPGTQAFAPQPRLEEPRTAWRKVAIGLGVLITAALVGTLIATKFLSGGDSSAGAGTTGATPSGPVAPAPVTIKPAGARIVDPGGDGGELKNAERTIDGDAKTTWETDSYLDKPNFGNIDERKTGMGVLIDLGSPRQVDSVSVDLTAPGGTLELKVGDTDPVAGKPIPTGAGEALNAFKTADVDIVKSFPTVAGPQAESPANPLFTVAGHDKPVRYVLVWITKLPKTADGRFKLGVQEVTVRVR